MDNERRKRFSRRHGYASSAREITVRHEAPEDLRGAVLLIAKEVGLGPSVLRTIICEVLRKLPDQDNWSEYPNVWGEVQNHVIQCEWFKVYDIAEAIYAHLARHTSGGAEEYQKLMNEYFVENGIGWKMVDGQIIIRGPEGLEKVIHRATEVLDDGIRGTARTEMHEAIQDISRRPTPDVTGSIQHAMAALECVARDMCGDSKATLGDILKQYPDKLSMPKPLNEVVGKAWGYASEMARHVREGRTPQFDEAELVVGLVATMITYLTRKESS